MNPERFSEEGALLTEETPKGELSEESHHQETDDSPHYDEKIAALRDQIRKAEVDMDEERVLGLEGDLHSLEQEKQASLEHVRERAEYEAARSAVAARFEEINAQVHDQAELVKRFENTDEERYSDTLARLRVLEQQRSEAGLFLSRYWGQSPEAYRHGQEQFQEDIASVETLEGLSERISLWGGIPQGEGEEFLTASEFLYEIKKISSPEALGAWLNTLGLNEETVRKLVEQKATESQENASAESVPTKDATGQEAKEGEDLVHEYNRLFLEETELHLINNFVHSRMFQSGIGFTAWSLISGNKKKLALLDKYGIDYSSVEARRSAATIGTAFRLREIADRKRELEKLLPHMHVLSPEAKIVEEAPAEPVREIVAPALAEAPFSVESPDPDLSSEEKPVHESAQEITQDNEEVVDYEEEGSKTDEEILQELKGVGVEVLPQGVPLMTEGREKKRRMQRLAGEAKLLNNLQKAVRSKLFTMAPSFYPYGKKLLLKSQELGIHFGTEKEKREAEALITDLRQKTIDELASLSEVKRKASPRLKRQALSESEGFNQVQQ